MRTDVNIDGHYNIPYIMLIKVAIYALSIRHV